jgi:sulfite reductase (NADPH) flavoprotein alpha-component
MVFDKHNPFHAKIIDRRVLNKPGSKKCTVHLTLDFSGSNIHYKVGDSVGIYPENSTYIVQETLRALGFEGVEMIRDSRTDEEFPIEEFLRKKANLSMVTKKWLSFILENTQNLSEQSKLNALLDPENKDEVKHYLEKRQLWDCFKEFKHFNCSPQEFVNKLSPLLPRFYSIASSPKKRHQEIDLLIAYFRYTTNEHMRFGVASHFLCEAADMHIPCIPSFLHPSKGFTLPSDPASSMIMIGPGTGVAPYRGFMQERVATQSTGKNWLFFGDWHEKHDFLYEEEWKKLEKGGHLKLSTAFSRDHEKKHYVQHLMLEHASELWDWVNSGAYFYVCGDAQHMAKDVDDALHHIIEKQGNMSFEESKHYVKEMKAQDRYLRDVY